MLIQFFHYSSKNPGAIKDTNAGINISEPTKLILIKSKINKLKISFAKLFDLFFPFLDLILKNSCGTNAELKVPSENNLLKVFGILKATKKASAKKPRTKKNCN